MTTQPRCGTVVYVTLPPTSHLYRTCVAASALPAWGAARAGAIAAAMHSAKTMTIDLMLSPYGSEPIKIRRSLPGLIPADQIASSARRMRCTAARLSAMASTRKSCLSPKASISANAPFVSSCCAWVYTGESLGGSHNINS